MIEARRGSVAAAIEIGGEIGGEAIFDLLAAAEEDRATLGARQSEFDDEDLRQAVVDGQPLRFTRIGASGDAFVELEGFCRQHALTYRRFGDGGTTGEPGVVFWQPGDPEPIRSHADGRGRLYLRLDELAAALAAGETLETVVESLRARSRSVPGFVITE